MAKTILFFTHARTACHLVERMLSEQKNTAYASHFFAGGRPLQTRLVEEGPYDKSNPETRQALHSAWEEGLVKLEQFLADAESQGKAAFYHEHAHFVLSPLVVSSVVHPDTDAQISTPAAEATWTLHLSNPSIISSSSSSSGAGAGDDSPRSNPTVLPDAFLLRPGTQPLFLIRHPALGMPSIWRTMASAEAHSAAPSEESVRLSYSLQFSRLLYDWFLQQSEQGKGPAPLVFDSDEFVTNKAVAAAVCAAVGFDLDDVVYKWPKVPAEVLASMPPLVTEIMKTFLASDGVDVSLMNNNVDVAKQKQVWIEKYGAEQAAIFADLTAKALPDYEYLRSKRITA